MSIDIVNMKNFRDRKNAIDIALPVFAIQCEANPPVSNFLDAYEEAVLKFINLDLSTPAIAKTLNTTESLIETILCKLQEKEYVVKIKGYPWKLTENGMNYINGSITEQVSSKAEYGWMFINSIKKEVLPYFYKGDLEKIPLVDGDTLPLKLKIDGSEEKTFSYFEIKDSKLNKAYRLFYDNNENSQAVYDHEITKDQAEDIFEEADMFEDLESLDEELEEDFIVNLNKDVYDENINDNDKSHLRKNMFIRRLRIKNRKLFLRMRVIIDLMYPGGYKVESPFDMGGVDDQYYFRQINWLENKKEVKIGQESLQLFIRNEICKISPHYNASEKDFHVYIMEKMPLLLVLKSTFSSVYDDMAGIYNLIKQQNSLVEKENIVGTMSRKVLEALFNRYFSLYSQQKIKQIKKTALREIKNLGHEKFKYNICKNINLSPEKLDWIDDKYLKTIVTRMTFTRGNSIMEKFINILVLNNYLSNKHITRFINSDEKVDNIYELISILREIRNTTTHDTARKFGINDYNNFMMKAPILAKHLLEGFRED